MSDLKHLTAFLDMLAAERGAAANTLEAYRRDLDDYVRYLAARQASIASAGALTSMTICKNNRKPGSPPHRARGGFRRSASFISFWSPKR